MSIAGHGNIGYVFSVLMAVAIAGHYTNTCDVVNWLACDNANLPRTLDGKTFRNAQLYNFDATPYESVMIGLHKIMCGRDNEEAAHVGLPKTTEIHFGYSRDGFHFDRPVRTPAIGDSGWWSGEWDAGYLAPVSSGFVIKDKELWFLYAAMRGDTSATNPPYCTLANGMHAKDCQVLDHRNATKAEIVWKGGNLRKFAGRPVRFRFKL